MSRVPLRNALYIARRDAKPAEVPPEINLTIGAPPDPSPYLTVHHPAPLPPAPPKEEPKPPPAPNPEPLAQSAAPTVDTRLLEEMRRLNEPLLQAVTALTEALYAEQEVVKDENRRIIGMRRKRPGQSNDGLDVEVSS